MIILVAIFKAKEDCAPELEKRLKRLVEQVRGEEGTLTYTLHRGIDDSKQFMFYEVYKDKESRQLHRRQPYVQETLASVMELVEEPPTISVFEDICAL